MGISDLIRGIAAKATGVVVAPLVNDMVDNVFSPAVSSPRLVPQGLRTYPVYLWSPQGKDYGLWPMAQAERICRAHSGWQWTIKHQRPIPAILSLMPMIVLIGIIAGVAKSTFALRSGDNHGKEVVKLEDTMVDGDGSI